jgi:hypothetical protein
LPLKPIDDFFENGISEYGLLLLDEHYAFFKTFKNLLLILDNLHLVSNITDLKVLMNPDLLKFRAAVSINCK